MTEERKKVTIRTLMRKKERGEKIVWLVVYDYPTALLADEAGVDMVLIGDSLGMNVLGYEAGSHAPNRDRNISIEQRVRRDKKQPDSAAGRK